MHIGHRGVLTTEALSLCSCGTINWRIVLRVVPTGECHYHTALAVFTVVCKLLTWCAQASVFSDTALATGVVLAFNLTLGFHSCLPLCFLLLRYDHFVTQGRWTAMTLLCCPYRIHCNRQFVTAIFNPLTPNDPYSGRTAPLTSERCILYIYSTNIGTECFKHGIYSSLFFSLLKMQFVS